MAAALKAHSANASVTTAACDALLNITSNNGWERSCQCLLLLSVQHAESKYVCVCARVGKVKATHTFVVCAYLSGNWLVLSAPSHPWHAVATVAAASSASITQLLAVNEQAVVHHAAMHGLRHCVQLLQLFVLTVMCCAASMCVWMCVCVCLH